MWMATASVPVIDASIINNINNNNNNNNSNDGITDSVTITL